MKHRNSIKILSACAALTLVMSSCSVLTAKKDRDLPRQAGASGAQAEPRGSLSTANKNDFCPAADGNNAPTAVTPPDSPELSASNPPVDGQPRPLGLTDENKAGKPRPRSELKSTPYDADKVSVREDGSWTYRWSYDPEGNKTLTVNTDGTWEYTQEDSREKTKVSLHADGSWDYSNEEGEYSMKMHTSPEGAWSLEQRGVYQADKYKNTLNKDTDTASEAIKSQPDGSWESDIRLKSGEEHKISGASDGTVTYHNGEKEYSLPRKVPDAYMRLLSYERDPLSNSTHISFRYGVGDNSVIPLELRRPLPLGTKASLVKAGSEEERRGMANLALTDDNKAGKPRPVSTGQKRTGVTVGAQGSWNVSSAFRVGSDGTWQSAETEPTRLEADGSWKSETKQVNPDGSWSWRRKGNKETPYQVEVYASGAWCYHTESETVYWTPRGKIYRYGKGQWSKTDRYTIDRSVHYEADNTYRWEKHPQHDTPGGGGVIPLRQRNPLNFGQKAYSG